MPEDLFRITWVRQEGNKKEFIYNHIMEYYAVIKKLIG